MKPLALLFAASMAGPLLMAQRPQPPAPPSQPAWPQGRPAGQPPQVLVWNPGGGSFLGVHATDVDTARARELRLKDERGVEITSVEPGSPAEKAGIQRNDVVVDYNGQRVEGTEQFVRLVRETPPGRHVSIEVWRGGSSRQLAATLGRRKARTAKELMESLSTGRESLPPPQVWIPDIPKAFTSWRSSMLGVEAESIDGQLAQYFGVPEGVLVRSVADGSAAARAGLKAGDVVVKIDGKPVETPREISIEMRSLRPRRTFPIGAMRDRREISLTVTLDEESESDRRPDPREEER
ncbi:MAG: PDZ domain-containing protein [Bryobacterales bacterium]|nr:PDZ domain-containing protein [Bryobacterales bacterium]